MQSARCQKRRGRRQVESFVCVHPSCAVRSVPSVRTVMSFEMDRILELLLIDIDRLCSQFAELKATDSTMEETEQKRQSLKKRTESVLKRTDEVLETWTKQQSALAQRLSDAVAKLTECSENVFPAKDSAHLKSIREEIKRKIGQYAENGPSRKVQATVNVNVRIDRNLFAAAAKNGQGTSRTALKQFTPTSRPRPPSSNALPSKTDVGSRSSRNLPSPVSTSDSHAEQEKLPNVAEEERSSKVWFNIGTGSGSIRRLPSTVSASEDPMAEREKLPNVTDRSSRILVSRKTASSASKSEVAEQEKLPNVAEEEKSSKLWFNITSGSGSVQRFPSTIPSSEELAECEKLINVADQSSRVLVGQGRPRKMTISVSNSEEAERETLSAAEEERSSKVWFNVGSGPESDSSSPSDSRNIISLRTNTEAVPTAPEEKTDRIWMKDENEDKGGVQPRPYLQRKSTSRSLNLPSKPAQLGVEKAKNGSNAGLQISSVPQSMALLESPPQPTKKEEPIEPSRGAQGLPSTTSETESQSPPSPYPDPLTMLWLILLALVMAFSGPYLRRWFCRAVATALVATDHLSMLLNELWCDVANAACETYGQMCTRFCASGMQRDIWNSRRV